MHQKYTLTICDIEINVISDESPEAVEALVSIVDRKMRGISQKSNKCSKTEAAILCSLDYCSDKIRAQRRVKAVESKLALVESNLDEVIDENETLKQEIASLKKLLEAAESKSADSNASATANFNDNADSSTDTANTDVDADADDVIDFSEIFKSKAKAKTKTSRTKKK